MQNCAKSARRRKYDRTMPKIRMKSVGIQRNWIWSGQFSPSFQIYSVSVVLSRRRQQQTEDDTQAKDEADEAREKSVDGGNNEKEKKPWKCLEGSNGYFIYKNMAENWCGSSPEWGECSVAMEQ